MRRGVSKDTCIMHCTITYIHVHVYMYMHAHWVPLGETALKSTNSLVLVALWKKKQVLTRSLGEVLYFSEGGHT